MPALPSSHPGTAGPARSGWAGLRDLRSISPRPASWPNSVLAAVMLAAVVGGVIAEPPTHVDAPLVVGGLFALVPFLLLPWRPRIPEGLLAAAVCCGLVAAGLGVAAGSDIVAMIAVYTVGSKRTERETIAAIAVAWLGSLAAGLIHPPDAGMVERVASHVVLLALYAALGWLGRWINKRRTYLRDLVDRTQDLERERLRLEGERGELARQAVADERARIARELHDVVAHHVSVMVIQAGAAQATLRPGDPGAEAAGQSLEAIRQTGREALAELRRMLGLLRADVALDPTETEPADADLAPQPGLSDLGALVDRMTEAGLIVDFEAGDPRRIPPGVDLSAYRVIQEALTNVLRHAGAGAHARVSVAYDPVALTLEVVDDGAGRRTTTEHAGVGHGLVGMRERVALFSGTLEAGPLPEGGFRVRARFPLAADGDPQPGPVGVVT